MVHRIDITDMDDLLRHFQMLCTSGLSPLETLNQLYGSFSERITGEVKCLGGSASGLKLYSAKIVLTDGPYFAATDLAQEKAVEKAVTQAFNYLTEEAAKLPVIVAKPQLQPEQPQIKPLVDHNEAEQDDVTITEEELTHLQTVLEGLGYQIIVKNSSYDATTVSNCLQIVYTCELDIPGLGKFTAESSASHTVATRKAGLKLKQFCVQFLGLEDPVIPQNESHFEPPPQVQQPKPPSPQPPSPPVASSNDFQPTQNASINNQIVPYYPGNSSKDEQLIAILNRFNEVYSPKKNPVSIMNEVLQTTGNFFSIETSKVDAKLSKTVIKVPALAIYTARHPDPKQCRKDALTKFCQPLRSLARLFVVFRQVDTPEKPPLAILDELVRNCGDIVKVSTVKVVSKPNKKHQTTISVNFLQSFVCTYTTDIGSRRKAADQLNAYLRKLKPSIIDSPQMDYSLKNAPLAHLYNQQESPSYQQPENPSRAVALLPGKDSPRASSPLASSPGPRQSTLSPDPPAPPVDYKMYLFPRDNRVIDFLSLFKTVNDTSQPPMVIINELLTRDYQSFKIETHQKETSTYLTQVQVVDFGLFFGVATNELESRKRALTHLYETLVEVVQFLDNFTYVYTPTKQPEEYLPLLFAEHPKLVQVQTWPNANQHHFVIVINYIHHFNEASTIPRMAKKLAFGKMTQFLFKFTGQLNSKCPKRTYRVPSSVKAPPPAAICDKTQENVGKEVNTVSSLAIVETASVSGASKKSISLPTPAQVSPKRNQQLVVPVKPSSKASGKGKLPKYSPYVTASGADTETAARQFAAKHRDQIELINLFNSAYDPSKGPCDLMSELVRGNAALFRENTVRFPTCWKTALFLPTIHQQFTGEGSTEREALQVTYKQAFRWLNNLSYLFATFRKVYSSSLPGSEIIRPLLKDDLLTMNTELNSGTGGMLSTVSLEAFSASFTCTGRYDYDSQNGAYTQAVAFFIAISDKIFDSSAQANIEYIETDEDVQG